MTRSLHPLCTVDDQDNHTTYTQETLEEDSSVYRFNATSVDHAVLVASPSAMHRPSTCEPHRNVPEQLRSMGVETFNEFATQMGELKDALDAFDEATKRLGDASDCLMRSTAVKTDVKDVLHAVQENANKFCDVPPPDVGESDGRTIGTVGPEIEQLATSVADLLQNIIALSPWQDKKTKKVFDNIVNDLRYWAVCLELLYSKQLEEVAVRMYANDLTIGISARIRAVIKSLEYMNEIALPMVAMSQHHDPSNLQNLTGIATFFSGVTATTLGYTYELDPSYASTFVNAFWFSSLVFSVASTVNLLLGALLLKTLARTPVRVPALIYMWLYGSPLTFLVIAVACFSIGLVGFAYTSNQQRVTTTATTVFSTFSYVGLLAVVIWFMLVKFGLLKDHDDDEPKAKAKGSKDAKQPRRQDSDDAHPAPRKGHSLDLHDTKSCYGREPEHAASQHTLVFNPKRKFQSAVYAVMAAMSLKRGQAVASSHGNEEERALPTNFIAIEGVTLQCVLGRERPQEDVHLRDAKFSPDGTRLAICGGEAFSLLRTLKEDDEGKPPQWVSRSLFHSEGVGYADELTWSPDGNYLITKFKYAFSVWTKDGDPLSELAVNRHRRVKSIVWMHGSANILSLEILGRGISKVVKLTKEGAELATFSFDSLTLRCLAVCRSRSSPWLWAIEVYDSGVQKGKQHPKRKPSHSELDHKALIAYDMTSGRVVARVPLYHDAREVMPSSDDKSVLVVYKDKITPQLWELTTGFQQSIVLNHSYASMPAPTTHASRLAFIEDGHRDDMVISTEEDNGIVIFDREKGTHFSTIPWDAPLREQRCLALGRTKDGTVLVAAGSDQDVKLWVGDPHLEPQPTLREENLDDKFSLVSTPPHEIGEERRDGGSGVEEKRPMNLYELTKTAGVVARWARFAQEAQQAGSSPPV